MTRKLFILIVVVLMSGCSKEFPDQPYANKLPKTFLWLFPDSTVAEGHSKQRVRWWGEDEDGVIKGYLFGSGKFPPGYSLHDTISWRWRTGNDSLIAFPLYVKRDTFQLVVHAVDNSFLQDLPDQALVRWVPEGADPATYAGPPFWDRNENGQPDPGEPTLPSLAAAVDPKGAALGIPVLNQPPSVVYAQNPNDPSVVMQQPDTTFTAVSFGWVGADPDGDATINSYEIALNDTTDPSAWFVLPGNVRLVSLVVPRSRSAALSGVQTVTADVWTGTFSTTRRLVGTIPNLKLDTLNSFYVRARDIAGDASGFIKSPSDTLHHWFVKNPRGKLLIVNDYLFILDRGNALTFYRDKFAQAGFPESEVLDIGRGLDAPQKRNTRFGKLVPPYLDPALIFTLQLFDVVFWYTDPYPSLGVAQVPLYQYTHDASHPGKVIFSTEFETSSDPRGAITDFSPLDSISSVSLVNSRLLPTMGDTRIPGDYKLLPDASTGGGSYPTLQFTPGFHLGIYLRPIYKQANAQYIYYMQPDTILPLRYTSLATLNDLRSVTTAGTDAWSCGGGGAIVHSSDAGDTWSLQATGTLNSLESIKFPDPNNGWAVGQDGTILQTVNGGANWANRSVVTLEDLLTTYFLDADTGIIGGTHGLFIRTTNAAATDWTSLSLPTNNAIRSIDFLDGHTGFAVGDSGYIIKSTNSGRSWRAVHDLTVNTLYSVKMVSPSLVLACGVGGTVVRSTDGGESWNIVGPIADVDLHSISSVDESHIWVCGLRSPSSLSGTILSSADGGVNWTPSPSGVGQNLYGTAFTDRDHGWTVGTGGCIIRTNDGGSTWTPQPRGRLNIGVIGGAGLDGRKNFLFLGLPLHLLDGASTVVPFLQHVLHDEFGE